MREAVILSTARTGITKAFRGELNATHGADFGAAAAKAAVERSGIDPNLLEDAIFGCGMPESATGGNIARHIGVRAGLPLSMTGGTVSRHCGSGLFAIAQAASQITQYGAPAMLAGGLESISIVQSHLNMFMYQNDWMMEHKPAMYMPMIETADIVAARYNVSREAQDEYSYQSQSFWKSSSPTRRPPTHSPPALRSPGSSARPASAPASAMASSATAFWNVICA